MPSKSEKVINIVQWAEKQTRRSYTEDEIAEALAITDGCIDPRTGEKSYYEAQKITGIPDSTLKDWDEGKRKAKVTSTESFGQLRENKKANLSQNLMQLAAEITSAASGKIQKAGLKDSLVAAGIAIEKAMLLQGEPTERVETVERQSLDDRVEQLRKQALEAAQKRGISIPLSTTETEGETVVPAHPPISA